jgi:GGDEF domain-containing protein
VTRTVQVTCRVGGIATRYGDEELAVPLNAAADEVGPIAERIHAVIEAAGGRAASTSSSRGG